MPRPERRRRKTDEDPIKGFMQSRHSVNFDDIEFQRRFAQNIIRYGYITAEEARASAQTIVNNTVVSGGGGGGGGCYWTKEGSNLVYYEGNVGIGAHPHDNDFEVRGNVLIEAIAEQPYLEIRNWSDTDTQDPVVHWSLGATPVKKFTMGVDDSDADAWLLCSGDILTSVVTDQIYSLAYNYSGKIAIADTNNHRVHVYTTAGVRLASAGDGSTGSGDDEFSSPWAICNDGIHVYIVDSGNDRIVKRKISDLSFVAKVGTTGSGNDQFDIPRGICTDGVYLYITEFGNDRVSKRLCSDLSFVDSTIVINGTHNFNNPEAICTDGTFLYITMNAGAMPRLVKLTVGLAPSAEIHDDGYIDSCSLYSICVRGGFLYLVNANTPGTLLCVYKYTASALSYVTHYLTGASVVHGTPYMLYGVDTDGTNLYVGNNHNAASNPQEVQVYTMAGAWVSEFGTYGTTVDNFHMIRGVSLCGTISQAATIPYRAPILKAGLDGSYVDSYPVHRFRDQIQLMEDGVVAATKYIGINAPSAITASYNITLPAAVPGAQGHAAISTAGVVTWGQNVGTTGSPTFVRITSLSVATGTAPITVTSTTVCTNLNAGMVDGYHHNQSLLIAAGPSFDHVHLTVAIGTAPLVVTSTTAVTNLNADLLDGSHAAAFAAAAHNHSGVYEPVLGNPGTDGWVLSSTILGVRSWIAPGGGAAAFLELTDVTEADYVGHALQFVRVNAAENGLEFTASSVAAHDILSASHGDALASAVSRGSIIYGNSTPKWAELPVGNAGDVLTTDGTDVAWAAPGGASHAMLSATHTDTLADTVIRGDILYGNATPKWARLAKGTSGHILTMGADEPSWSAPAEPGMFTLINESVDGLSTAALHGQGTYAYFGAWASTLVGTSTIAVVAHPVSGKMIQVTGDTVTEGSSYSAIVTTFQVGLGSGTRIRWKMRTSDVTVGTKGCAVGTAFGSEVAQVYFRATGSKITFWNRTTNTDLMTAVNNTWYQIDMIIIQGTTACYAYVFIDGVQQGAPKVCATVTVVVDTFWVYCNTTGTAAAVNLDVDDIQVGTNWFWNLVE